MKVLIIHNTYQQRGGEDVVVENEVAMLQSRAHEVGTWIVSNHSIRGRWREALVALSVIFSLQKYRDVLKLLKHFEPDVVHVHNFFPLISPSVFYACHKMRIPSVFTLHNFRILCPTSLLMHDGAVTELSLKKGPWWAVKRRVYRGSFFGTLALAAMIYSHNRAGTWTSKVSRFIALTEFAAKKFEAAGLPAPCIAVKPNFVDIAAAQPSDERSGLLFVGRLSNEKGLEVLVEATRLCGDRGDLVEVVGVGPLAGRLKYVSGLVTLGQLSSDAVHKKMASSLALVMPSLWYEGFPMVLVEAYASGLPVIASRLGALAELVEHGVTGLLFEPGCALDLAEKMQWAVAHPGEMAEMGRMARRRYETTYTEQINYLQLMAIYEDAIESVKNGK